MAYETETNYRQMKTLAEQCEILKAKVYQMENKNHRSRNLHVQDIFRS